MASAPSSSRSSHPTRSHTQELLAGPKPRSTCDRCHVQKLRCVKSATEDRCLRCLRQQTPCNFSPRSRRVVRRREVETASSPFVEPSQLLPLPPPAGLGATPIHCWPQTQVQMQSLAPFQTDLSSFSGLFDPMIFTSDQFLSPLTVADAVRELADLNVRLFDHYSTLPPPLQQGGAPSDEPVQDRLFAIDQTFTLTRTLIGILKRFYAYLDGCGIDSSPVDEATALLILSCCYRLMDIYESIIRNIQSCSQNPKVPLPGEQPVITLPSFQIGSYTASQLYASETASAPSMATISLQMMVLLMISSQLCEELRGVISTGMGRVQGENITGVDVGHDRLHLDVIPNRGDSCTIFDGKMEKRLQDRWHALMEQMSNTKHSLVLFSFNIANAAQPD